MTFVVLEGNVLTLCQHATGQSLPFILLAETSPLAFCFSPQRQPGEAMTCLSTLFCVLSMKCLKLVTFRCTFLKFAAALAVEGWN